jgi:ribonuclease BN (tRNA processing enzyme)
MIEVTVLGSGAALPAPGQTNSAYLVRAGAVRLLVDCGPAILQQLAAVGLTPGDVTHLFVTHRHGDHTLGYPLLLLWWLSHGRGPESFPLTLTGEATWASLEALVGHSLGDIVRRAPDPPRRLFADREPTVLPPLDAELTLRTWPMEHSSFAPVSGLRVEFGGAAAAFTGDTAPCDNVVALARGADLLVHESAYSATLDPHLPDGLHGHSTARSAGRAAADAGARRLALVHLSAHYAGRQDVLIAEAAREFAGEVTAPAAGTVYTLGE